MRIYLIINPSSGRGRTQQLLPQLKERFSNVGHTVEFAESGSLQDLIDLATKATAADFDIVAAVGGDGTVHYVLTGIVNALRAEPTRKFNTALAILPLGRGNDIARTLKIPEDLDGACQVLLNAKRQIIDLAFTGKNYYAGVAGIGFDSEATRVANETKLKGKGMPASFIYTYAVLSVLMRYKPKWVRIKHDQGVFEGKIMMAAISNGQTYGGGMRITPMAILDDGLLDICIVREVSKLRLIANFPQVFRGEHINNPLVTYFRSAKVEVETEDRLELYGDGEYLEDSPLKIEIIPQLLPIIVP